MWERENDLRVLEYGQKHLNVVAALDAAAGGRGPYGEGPTTILDWYGFGEKKLKEASEVYSGPEATEIRKLANRGEPVGDLAREFADEYDLKALTRQLHEMALKIENPYKKGVRLGQAKSLRAVAHVLESQLKKGKSDLDYERIVGCITGIEPALIPTREILETQRGNVLELMGCPRNANLFEAAKRWRSEAMLLGEDEVGWAYQASAKGILEVLKSEGLLPEEAKLDVEILGQAPSLGSFRYGDALGQRPYGKTTMVKSGTKCLFEIIATAAHEIGGHYTRYHLGSEYADLTGDLFGATGTIATNQCALDEGFASCIGKVLKGDISDWWKDYYFGRERTFAGNFDIALELEKLHTHSFGHAAASHFMNGVGQEELEKMSLEFGVDPDRARNRAVGLCDPASVGKSLLHPLCYSSLYYPGTTALEPVLGQKKVSDLKETLCGENGPASLSALCTPGEL
ncbi:MAG: hypothetical protein JW727_05915 [Candidatus Aenigmarchaeota archaeon]|nr:hypothetical protein [Candidatus Aenigmarchaeota archaeon]